MAYLFSCYLNLKPQGTSFKGPQGVATVIVQVIRSFFGIYEADEKIDDKKSNSREKASGLLFYTLERNRPQRGF